MTSRTRTRLAEGIYRDRFGLAATVKVRGVQRERRWPSDTSLDVLRSWRVQMRAELDADREQIDYLRPRGTLVGDLPQYLKLIAGRVGFAADRSHLRSWLPLVGAKRRSDINRLDVQRAIAAWAADGKSPRTLRHRRRVLRELYCALDGPSAKPPTTGVKIPRIPDPNPTPVARSIIEKVAKSLKRGRRHTKGYGSDSDVTYARFLVRATTGQRPAQIMRATRDDVDLLGRIWWVRPAKAGRPIPFPLNGEMVRAWRTFIAAKAWGKFDTRSFSKTLRRHGWPANIRPYTLRHTFAIDHLLKGTTLEAVQGLLGHKSIDTTRKHYAPVLLALLRKSLSRRQLKLA